MLLFVIGTTRRRTGLGTARSQFGFALTELYSFGKALKFLLTNICINDCVLQTIVTQTDFPVLNIIWVFCLLLNDLIIVFGLIKSAEVKFRFRLIEVYRKNKWPYLSS